MTPESRHSIASNALALQGRLNQLSVEAATEAKRIFDDDDDEFRRRWLALEFGIRAPIATGAVALHA